jgi:hypothetical protein
MATGSDTGAPPMAGENADKNTGEKAGENAGDNLFRSRCGVKGPKHQGRNLINSS